MVLPMARPYEHPKTGVYWVRKVVPEGLRSVVGKRELKASLGTKDAAAARAAAPAVLARFETLISAARTGGSRLTDREAEALCGEWYREQCDRWADDAGDPEQWAHDREFGLEARIEPVGDPTYPGDPLAAPQSGYEITNSPEDIAEARAFLQAHGHLPDRASVRRFAEMLFHAKLDFNTRMERRAGGDLAPDPAEARYAGVVDRRAASVIPKGATFEALVAAWAAESGTTGKALYDRERTAKGLSDFLGHNQAARVTAEDVVRWKEHRLAAGRSVKTVANDIGELRPIWHWGKQNRKITFAENPFSGIAPPTNKRAGRPPRGPYDDKEAATILSAARKERSSLLRWFPWLACFTGARLGELVQAVREDVKRDCPDGPYHLHIHMDGEGRTLKTPQSERQVPLHPALVTEGFLAYVQALPPGSPLFPGLRRDQFGTFKADAGKRHSRWVRRVVGITDERKDPAHAWRHWFEDAARDANLQQTVTDALLGHLNQTNQSEGYGRGFRFKPDITAPMIAKLASPLDPR